jgi:Fic family protein
MKKLEDYRSGNYVNVDDYKSFIPSEINEDWVWNDSELNTLLSKASLELGNLNGYASQIPNIDIYIQMHVKVEANKSSRIEGTRTTIDEDLSDVLDINPEKRDDWQEVKNYVEAVNYGFKRINEIPISNRLIKELHAILLKNVRGEHKNPGEYRKSQNWIGGSRPGNAVYVPPIPSKLMECLSDLEKFINNNKINTPDLIKIAIIHYQFESIHPFLDGNGRTGRIIIPLYMMERGLINKPYFYISDYIEKNKNAYYDFLSRVRTNNDMISWIKFFLECVIETAKNARIKFESVVNFTNEMNEVILKLPVKAENAKKVIDVLYQEPIINRKMIQQRTLLKDTALKSVVNALVKEGLLVETTGFNRNQIFSFQKYIDLFKN